MGEQRETRRETPSRRGRTFFGAYMPDDATALMKAISDRLSDRFGGRLSNQRLVAAGLDTLAATVGLSDRPAFSAIEDTAPRAKASPVSLTVTAAQKDAWRLRLAEALDMPTGEWHGPRQAWLDILAVEDGAAEEGCRTRCLSALDAASAMSAAGNARASALLRRAREAVSSGVGTSFGDPLFPSAWPTDDDLDAVRLLVEATKGILSDEAAVLVEGLLGDAAVRHRVAAASHDTRLGADGVLAWLARRAEEEAAEAHG